MGTEYTLLSTHNQEPLWIIQYIDQNSMLILNNMTEIKFDDSLSSTGSGSDSILYSRFQKSNERPTLVNFLLNWRIVKSEKAANIILLIITLLFFVAAISIIYFFFYYTPAPAKGQGRVPNQVLIMQKTQEYVGQGLSAAEARQKATAEVMQGGTTN